MSSLLPQLDNDSMLLMYVSGELSEPDRVEVQRLLEVDGQLREQCEALRNALAHAGDAFRAADAAERVALPAGAAVRRVGQAVRSWHAERLRTPPAPQRRQGLRLPWWSYPVAGAAVLAIVLTLWVRFQEHRVPTELRPFGMPGVMSVGDDGVAINDASTPDMPWVPYGVIRDENKDALDEVEAELYALSEPLHTESSIFLFGEIDER